MLVMAAGRISVVEQPPALCSHTVFAWAAAPLPRAPPPSLQTSLPTTLSTHSRLCLSLTTACR